MRILKTSINNLSVSNKVNYLGLLQKGLLQIHVINFVALHWIILILLNILSEIPRLDQK